MQRDLLEQLLSQQEGVKLEFKRDMYKIYDKNAEATPREKDEMIKDIISLANGNPSYAGEKGYLIIGVENAIPDNGARQIHGISGKIPEAKELLQAVNAACDPPISTLICNVMDIDNKKVVVITIPPTPHVHETTRNLKTPKAEHSKHVVFFRIDESIEIASYRDRETLQRLKTAHFVAQRGVPPVLFGSSSGAIIGGTVTHTLAQRMTTEPAEKIGWTIGGSIIGGLLGGGMGSSVVNLRQAMRDFYDIPPKRRPLALALSMTGGIGMSILIKRGLEHILMYLQKKAIPKPPNNPM